MPYMCTRCQIAEVEVIDDWTSTLCAHCADIVADRERERREWAHFHPPITKDDADRRDSSLARPTKED